MVFSSAYLDCSKGSRAIPLHRGGVLIVALDISVGKGVDVVAAPPSNNPNNRKNAGPFCCLWKCEKDDAAREPGIFFCSRPKNLMSLKKGFIVEFESINLGIRDIRDGSGKMLNEKYI